MMLEISGIGIATAFAAGAISFLSPCVLPIVPGYLSYIAGRSGGGPSDAMAIGRLRTFGLSLYFVLGFSTVFMILGASATALGRLLLHYRYETNIIGGAVVVLFGLLLTGLVHPGQLQREHRFEGPHRGGRPSAAYLLGLAFGFGWTPCIGPVLGAILTVSAATATVREGIVLLAIYSLGLGLPFLAAAAFTGEFMARLRSLRRLGRLLQVLAGGVVVAMGVAMITGYMSTFALWLLNTFPGLATIG